MGTNTTEYYGYEKNNPAIDKLFYAIFGKKYWELPEDNKTKPQNKKGGTNMPETNNNLPQPVYVEYFNDNKITKYYFEVSYNGTIRIIGVKEDGKDFLLENVDVESARVNGKINRLLLKAAIMRRLAEKLVKFATTPKK